MSRPVTVSIPHSLGKNEAQRRINEGFGHMRQQLTSGMGAMGSMFSFHERWEGDRLHFDGGGLGQKLTGRLDVHPDKVEIQIDLPEILAAIAEKVAGTLRSEGQKLLEKK